MSKHFKINTTYLKERVKGLITQKLRLLIISDVNDLDAFYIKCSKRDLYTCMYNKRVVLDDKHIDIKIKEMISLELNKENRSLNNSMCFGYSNLSLLKKEIVDENLIIKVIPSNQITLDLYEYNRIISTSLYNSDNLFVFNGDMIALSYINDFDIRSVYDYTDKKLIKLNIRKIRKSVNMLKHMMKDINKLLLKHEFPLVYSHEDYMDIVNNMNNSDKKYLSTIINSTDDSVIINKYLSNNINYNKNTITKKIRIVMDNTQSIIELLEANTCYGYIPNKIDSIDSFLAVNGISVLFYFNGYSAIIRFIVDLYNIFKEYHTRLVGGI